MGVQLSNNSYVNFSCLRSTAPYNSLTDFRGRNFYNVMPRYFVRRFLTANPQLFRLRCRVFPQFPRP